MAAVAFPAAPSHAASTLVVSATGVTANCPNATYTTIGAAVTAAVAGDTIHVCPGLYNEIVEVNKANLTVEGETTLPANCDVFAAPDPLVDSIIEATSPSGEGIVNLREDGIRFQGFTVQNTRAPPSAATASTPSSATPATWSPTTLSRATRQGCTTTRAARRSPR
ncbi:hypothetical protein V6P99_17510 [Streptomyces virginiae]|uniref:hypothetical protein n=1 Tax=Streptomyces TaxID=1883 RepID=UPI00131BAF98|nr:hypothetical protein [Streptomyces sp. XY511]